MDEKLQALKRRIGVEDPFIEAEHQGNPGLLDLRSVVFIGRDGHSSHDCMLVAHAENGHYYRLQLDDDGFRSAYFDRAAYEKILAQWKRLRG